MKRRFFLSGLGAGAAFWTARSAPAAANTRPATVGFLALGRPDPEPWFSGVEAALEEFGYRQGSTVRIERRSGGGDHERLRDMALDLVRLKVDAIVAFQTPAASAARDATPTIPVIISRVGDPVGTGLVASLSRPGGNLTGMSAASPGLAGKLVDIVRELLPEARRLAVLLNGADPYSKPLREHIESGAARNRLEVVARLAQPEDDFEPVVRSLRDGGAEALFIQPTLVGKGLLDAALRHRLPTFSNSGAALGVLVTLGPSRSEQDRGTAEYVGKVLRGRQPADLPVAQPTAFDFTVNNATAQALGLDIPPHLLARADQLID